MLASESTFAGLALTTDAEEIESSPTGVTRLPPDRRRQLEADLARWRALSGEDRQRGITAQFQSFLTLRPSEQQATLARLDADSREKAARLMRRLEALTPEQQTRSLNALKRFTALAPPQRERFLRNAARWSAMSADAKAAWRRLHNSLPPMPPGWNGGVATPPELPTNPPSRTRTASSPRPQESQPAGSTDTARSLNHRQP